DLRKSEEKFKDVFNSMTDMFSRVTFAGIVEMVSPSVFDMLGYKAEELIGKKAINYYVNPDERLQLISLIKEKGYCRNFEIQVRTRDGDVKYLSLNAKIYTDKDNKPIGIESVTRDITAKKIIENELIANTALLRESQKIARLGHLKWDIATNNFEWSDEVFRMYGVSPDVEPTFESTLEYVHPDDLIFVEKSLEAAVQQVKVYNIEHRIIRADNQQVIWVHAQAKLKFDEQGNPLSLIGTVLDISDKKSDEKALRDSEAEFRSIYESSYSGIPQTDLKGNFIKTNKRFREITGYSEAELMSMSIADVTHPHHREESMRQFKELISGKIPHFEVEKIYIKKNGEEIICNTLVSALLDSEGKPISAIATITDITEQKRVKQKLSENTIRLDEAQQLSHLGSWALEIPSNNLTWSDESYRIFGVEKSQQPTYQRWLKMLHPEDRERAQKLIEGLYESSGKIEFEYRIIRPDGVIRHLHCWNTVELDKNGVSLKMLGATLDITERKAVEKQNQLIKFISQQLNNNHNLHDFCQLVFSELQQVKQYTDIHIWKYDDLDHELSVVFQIKNDKIKQNLPKTRKKGNGLSEFVIRTNKGLMLSGKELSTFYKKHNLKKYNRELKSWMGVPLVSENKVIGILVTQSFSKNNSFTKGDLELLSFIAIQVGSLIGRLKTEQEVKQFEKYFSVSMDLLCITGNNGSFKKINSKFSEVLGYSEDELLSKPFTDLVHPDDLEATYTEIEKLSLGATAINFINRYRSKDGQYKWFLWEAASDNETDQIYAAAKDITEQMKSQEILTALADIQDTFIAEDATTETFETMLNILLRVTQSEYGFIGEVLYKNDQPYLKTYAITNISWNKETADFYKENAPKGLIFRNMETLFGKVITTGKPVISNDPYHDPRKGGLPKGHPRLDHFMGLPFYHNHELVGIVGIANKIGGYKNKDAEMLTPFLATCSTLIRAYQNAIKRKNAEIEVLKLADIVSYSSDAIISTNQDGKVISWNLGAEKLLGYSQKEIIGEDVGILGPVSLKSEHDKIIQHVRSGNSIDSYETKQIKKDGTTTYVNMSIFPLIDETGKVKGISSILRDISEQKEAQQMKEEFTKKLESMVSERTSQLENTRNELALSLAKEKELGELKSRFVSTASHQFRTPLTVIQSSMGILSMQRDNMDEEFRPRFEKVYNRIKGQISRMTELMNDVLIIGKINGGNIELSLIPTDVVALCKGIIASYDETQTDNRKMGFKTQGNPRKIMLDTRLMEHAISNLISNAFKYSVGRKAPETIILFTESEVEILVKDSGIGIPSKDIPQLFEPFYRASNVNEVAGTGLGIAIAKEYVELNNGHIEVETKVNKGTKFRIKFDKLQHGTYTGNRR
ncbi:MAG: PAS domain S-box protein, partial [Flavobacteriales bacterium]|nr:PAS domain S-box protein [Flavobacteriales bacterium]